MFSSLKRSVPKRTAIGKLNEEGKLRKLKQNALAMNIFKIEAVGNVVICPKRLFS